MPEPVPTVVVSGPPRSGTSLLMQMLAAAGIEPITDGTRGEDPDNPRGYFEHNQVMRLAQNQEVLVDSAGKGVKIIHALLKHIPGELPLAVLFLERDLDEVLASQAVMLDRLGRPQPTLGPERMRDIFAKQLQLARQELAHRPHTTVLDVRYRELVDAPQQVAQQIAEFLAAALGRPIDAEAMAACVDRRSTANALEQKSRGRLIEGDGFLAVPRGRGPARDGGRCRCQRSGPASPRAAFTPPGCRLREDRQPKAA